MKPSAISSDTCDSDRCPNLLVSVRDAAEAAAALDGGADWIDLKEPLQGALGAVESAVARQIVEKVAGQCPTSAALGELLEWPNAIARDLLQIEELEVVKLGLAGCAAVHNWKSLWISAFQEIRAAGKALVAVVYADWQHAQSPIPQEIIELAQSVGGQYLLIDTYDKQFGSIFEHLSKGKLHSTLRLAKSASLTTVLAGSLTQTCLDQLPDSDIDLVAVRGAVCDGARIASVDENRVSGLKAEITNRWQKISPSIR